MIIQCPSCAQRYNVPDQNAGSLASCQVCQTQFQITPAAHSVESAPGAPVLKTAAAQDSWVPPSRRKILPRRAQSLLPSQGQGGSAIWKTLFDVRVFLGWLSDGSLIRNVTASAIYLFASIAALCCLAIWLQSLKLFGFVDGFIGLLGALLWFFFFPYSCFLAISAAFARAGDIRKLPSGQFAISPILSIIINLHGEVIFILCAAWSLPAALLAWSCYASLAMYFDMPLSDGLALGVALFVVMWLFGYMAYLVTRWLQELIYVFPSMAHHLDLIEKRLRKEPTDG